jgi:hypothetical protein|tara:strand:+ start:239 stop:496 length:258 start_codon:yes stop_codon:yes gene_type:complete
MITHHYSFSYIRRFLTLGYETGAVGMLLIKSDEETETYKGFGTIENPRKTIITFKLKKFKQFSSTYQEPSDISWFIPLRELPQQL